MSDRWVGSLTALVVLGMATACSEPMNTNPVATVILEPDSVTLAAGGTTTLAVTLLDAEGDRLDGRSIEWSVSEGGVVDVESSGLVTTAWRHDPALRSTYVIATSEGVSDSAYVTTSPVPAASVDFVPDSQFLTVGRGRLLIWNVRDAAGNVLSDRPVTWSTSDVAIVQVNEIGFIRAMALGTAIVSAHTEGISGSLPVTVGASSGIGFEQPFPDALVGDTVTVAAGVSDNDPITSVTATIGGSSAAMRYVATRFDPSSRECNPGGGIVFTPCWLTEELDIVDEPLGAVALTVTAIYATGVTRSRTIPVVHDPPPQLMITSPQQGAVVGSTVRLTFTCSDRNGAACTSVSVELGTTGPILASGVTGVDVEVPLPPFGGYRTLVFKGVDSAQQVTTVTREILVVP